MRILIINNQELLSSTGGATLVCGDISRGLAKRGHQVVTLAPNSDDQKKHCRCLKSIKPVHDPAKLEKPHAKLHWMIISRLNYKFTRNAIQNCTPDVLYIHNLEWLTSSPLRAAIDSGVRTVVHCHNNFYADGIRNAEKDIKNKWHRIFFKLGYPISGYRVIAVSKFIAANLGKAGFDGERISVVYNGLPDEIFTCGISPAKELKALFAGAISPHKGVHIAIQAIAVLQQQGINLPLEIIGVGINSDYRKQLDTMVNQNGLANLITFTSSLPRQQVWERMRKVKLVLVPSTWNEPFGLVAAEAMACGAVPVVSNQGGLPEVVAGGGIIVKPEAEDIAVAIQRFLGRTPEEQIKLSSVAIARAKKEFRMERVLNEVEQVLAQR